MEGKKEEIDKWMQNERGDEGKEGGRDEERGDE